MIAPAPVSPVTREPAAAYIDLHGAAEHFAVSYWTVRRWVQRGVLPATKLPGGIIRIPVAALDSIGEPAIGEPA